MSAADADLVTQLQERIASLEAELAAARAMSGASDVLLDVVPEVVLVLDADGRIAECNRVAEQTLGRPSTELLGLTLTELLEPASAAALTSLWWSGFVGRGASDVALPDGRWLSFSIARLDGDRGMLVLRDETRRVELEAELQRTRRLAGIGRLAGGLALELTTPLSVLSGRLDLLSRQPAVPPERLRRQIDVLLDHCSRIAATVRNLQVLGNPRAPRLHSTDLEAALADVIALGGRRLQLLRVEVEVSPSPLVVPVDPDHLRQAVLNLLWLSAESAPAGSVIVVRATPLQPTPTATPAVRISVQHAGPPLPESLLQGLRAPSLGPSQVIASGQGLGLGVAWALAQQHGGWLTAENLPEGGAALHLHFPAPVAQLGESDDSPPEGLVVLVVDDDAMLSSTVRSMLLGAVGEVRWAASAEEALVALARGGVDVVLSDIRLPGMDGERLAERVEEQWPHLAGRIVLTSGLLHQPRRSVPYLQKPFTRDQLLSALRAVAEPEA